MRAAAVTVAVATGAAARAAVARAAGSEAEGSAVAGSAVVVTGSAAAVVGAAARAVAVVGAAARAVAGSAARMHEHLQGTWRAGPRRAAGRERGGSHRSVATGGRRNSICFADKSARALLISRNPDNSEERRA